MRAVAAVLAAIAAVAGLMMLFSGLWIRSVFGDIGVEQLLFVLDAGESGAGAADQGIVAGFVVVCIVAPFLIVATAALIVRRLDPAHTVDVARGRRASRAITASVAAASALLLIGGAVTFFDRVSLWDHLAAVGYDGSIDAYYREPAAVTPPDEPINLILLYVESLDDAYADPTVVGDNLLEPLTRQTDDWMQWDEFVQEPGTGWTIASIVSTQCGIPLKSEALDDGELDGNAVGEQADRFLPGATCLGDILDDQGYRSVFLGGADPTFAGKGKFLLEHGYDEVLGLPHWSREGETDLNAWGLADAPLLDRARDTLDDLRSADEPYSLTVLTVDSHEPGFIGAECEAEHGTQMGRAVQCSAAEVAGFLRDIEQQGVLDDTAVVVMGDHLAMVGASSDFADELIDRDDRTIFHRASSPLDLEPARETIDHVSMFPTILRLMGFSFPEGRLGLGLSGVDDGETDGTIYELDREERSVLLEAPSTRIYERFWSGEAQ